MMSAPRAKPKAKSRDKGKVGELELAQLLRDNGYPDAARGVQYHGGPNSPDIVGGPPELHIECKRTETGNLYTWLDQAKRDAAEGRIPTVVHRKNNRDWVAILPFTDLLKLILGRPL